MLSSSNISECQQNFRGNVGFPSFFLILADNTKKYGFIALIRQKQQWCLCTSQLLLKRKVSGSTSFSYQVIIVIWIELLYHFLISSYQLYQHKISWTFSFWPPMIIVPVAKSPLARLANHWPRYFRFNYKGTSTGRSKTISW